jgi:hypothetical protein
LVIETTVQQAAPEVAGVEVEIPAAPAPLLQVLRRPGMDRAPGPAALVETGS